MVSNCFAYMGKQKTSAILTIFVVTDTTLQFVFCFVFACGEIALLWGNHIKTTGGIERIMPVSMLAISIYISVEGAENNGYIYFSETTIYTGSSG